MIKLNLQLHGAPGSLSALRSETFDKLQLNVGIFLKDFDYDQIANAEALASAIATAISSGDILGATRGGGQFSVSREMRDPEVDGLRYKFKGSTRCDSMDPQLSTTLVETTPDNFAAALGTKATTSGKLTTIKCKTQLDDDSYLENLCWAGELEDGTMVMIVLYNALNTSDFTFTFQDKGEGSFGVEFHGVQDDVEDFEYAPFEVIFFDHAGT